jgi:hypothetical protein
MAALTVAGVFLSVRLLSKSRWAAVFGAAAFGVSFTFWSQSVIAEVYSPGAAFMVAVWAFLLWWYRTGSKRALFLCGLCGGLGLGVNANLAVVAPAVAVFLLLRWKQWKEWWKPACSGALAGAILFLAVFLVVDLNAPPASSFHAIYGPARSAWGMSEADVANPVERMKFLLLARQWGGQLFRNPGEEMPAHWSDYVARLPREFSIPSFGLMTLGILFLIVRHWRVAVLFVAALLFHWLVYFNYSIWDIYVLYIPGYLLMAILAAVGLGGIAEMMEKLPWRRVRRWLTPVLMLAIMGICIQPVLSPRWRAVVAGRVPFLGVEKYVLAVDPGAQYTLVYNAVRVMNRDSIVLMDWNELWQYWYAARIEQHRDDLQFVELSPFHQTPGFPESTLAFIRANIGDHPVYLSTPIAEVLAAGFELHLVFIDSQKFYKVEMP